MRFKVGEGVTQIAREGDVFRAKDGFVELPESVGRELGLEAAPEGAPSHKGDGKKAEVVDISTMNVEKASATIAAAKSIEELEVFEKQEAAKTGGNPRKGVSDAIHARATALIEGDKK